MNILKTKYVFPENNKNISELFKNKPTTIKDLFFLSINFFEFFLKVVLDHHHLEFFLKVTFLDRRHHRQY